MVALHRTLDGTALLPRARTWRFNALLCRCIGPAASRQPDFLLPPVEDRMVRCEQLAIDLVVKTKPGGIATCGIPFCAVFQAFCQEYGSAGQAAESGLSLDLSETRRWSEDPRPQPVKWSVPSAHGLAYSAGPF